jgi:hypothetical protein
MLPGSFRIAAVLVMACPLVMLGRTASSQPCNISGRDILYSYAPPLCTQNSCRRTQKLVLLGGQVVSYFKRDLSDDSDADVGFVYKLGKKSNVLVDDFQRAGLRHALSQLSPGSRYDSYVIEASLTGAALTLTDDVRTILPYIGEMGSRIHTTIEIRSCQSCIASVEIETTLPNGSSTTNRLAAQMCRLGPQTH